ncbi:MAG: hypothetical protein WA082_03780 [Candidatus Moraniibacteriota bacterium]
MVLAEQTNQISDQWSMRFVRMPGVVTLMNTWVTVTTMLWNVRKETVCLVNGDKVLVDGQNDADIKLWNLASQTGEVIHSAAQHFLGAFDMETQIALVSTPKHFFEMYSAILTVGMWPDMEHVRTSDITEAGNHFVECLATIGFAGKHMCATGRPDDIFSVEHSSLRTDAFDFPIDDGVDPVVTARQNCVPFFFFV